jgi:hypothetical protein
LLDGIHELPDSNVSVIPVRMIRDCVDAEQRTPGMAYQVELFAVKAYEQMMRDRIHIGN